MQAPNSTEEVLSQLSHRHSGTLTAGAPLPSVAESTGASESEPQQQSAAAADERPAAAQEAHRQQAPPPQQADRQDLPAQPGKQQARAQQQAAPHQQAAQAWQLLQNAPPQLTPAQQQSRTPSNGFPERKQKQSNRKSAEATAAEASALFGTPGAGSRKRQTSAEHRRGDVAQLSSYGWLSTGGFGSDGMPPPAQPTDGRMTDDGDCFDCQGGQRLGPSRSDSGGALKSYSSGGSAGGGNRRISRDSDRCAVDALTCPTHCSVPSDSS